MNCKLQKIEREARTCPATMVKASDTVGSSTCRQKVSSAFIEGITNDNHLDNTAIQNWREDVARTCASKMGRADGTVGCSTCSNVPNTQVA
jgi:hypothetical protein